MEEEQRQAFITYLTKNSYAENTIYAYSRGIDRISRHMSDKRGDRISLYNIRDVRDLERLKRIRDTYSLNGNYSDIGNEGKATVRNAINRFVEFREWQYNHNNINLPVENNNIEKETEKIEIPDTPQKIIVNQDFNKIKQTLESLKGELQEINTTTKLIKVIFIFQVIILILLGYILY